MKASNLKKSLEFLEERNRLLPLLEGEACITLTIEELSDNEISKQLANDPKLTPGQQVWHLKVQLGRGNKFLFHHVGPRDELLNVGELIKRRIGELERRLHDLGVEVDTDIDEDGDAVDIF